MRAATVLKHRTALTTTKGNFAMADRADITPELLRQLLRYEPETGKLFWLARGEEHFTVSRSSALSQAKVFNSRHLGKPALHHTDKYGYLNGAIYRMPFKAHRVGWAIYHGSWPDGEIDHINGNPSDNRLSNLRDATRTENMKNRAMPLNTQRKYFGVSWSKKRMRWEARIFVDQKYKLLGYFASEDEAVLARKSAEREYGFHPNHGRALAEQEKNDGE